MLKLLNEQLLALPDLLRDPEAQWQSLDIDYHPPKVERVWRPILGNTHRIYLHRMHACSEEEAFKHTHPWPAAMKIVSGKYAMSMFYGAGLDPEHKIGTVVLAEGSSYEMLNPDGWHAVWPLTPVTLSVMITGPVFTDGGGWRGENLPEPVAGTLGPMSKEAKRSLLEVFRDRFWLRGRGKANV